MKINATEVFKLVHAGHDVMPVSVVCGPNDPSLICWTCHEEQSPEPPKSEKALRVLIEADPTVLRLWYDDTFFHHSIDAIRSHERHGDDPLYTAIAVLAQVCQSFKAMRDAELARVMREPGPPQVIRP